MDNSKKKEFLAKSKITKIIDQNNNSAEILIYNDKIKTGIYIAKNNAERFYNESFQHYKNAEYQSAIPSAIFGIEESSKFEHLLKHLQNGDNITYENWKNLKNHEFKLVNMNKKIKKEIENSSNLDQKYNSVFLQNVGLDLVAKSKTENIIVNQKTIEVLSKLPKLKEFCLYTNWNNHKNDWDKFNNISLSDQKALSLFVLNLLEHKLLLALSFLEYFEKPFPEISSEILRTPSKLMNYYNKKIEHARNMTTTKKMKIYESKTIVNLKEILLGHDVLNKYFSN